MQLHKHLYQDQAGDWYLHFVGEGLKVGKRQDDDNIYHVNLSLHAKAWIPVLKEWLDTFRPHRPGAATSPYVFLTQSGRPFDGKSLATELTNVVAMRTGRRFYPHLIRTIWATQVLKKNPDYAVAATRLGDTVAVVIKTYRHLVDDEQHDIASDVVDEILEEG
jgi:site-specific recombinase XerD